MNQINRTGGRLAELQLQVATGRRVRRPSQDIIAANQGMDSLSERRRLAGLKEATLMGRVLFVAMESAIGTATEIAGKARTLALHAGNEAEGQEEDDAAIAAEVDQLLEELVEVGNRRDPSGAYVFGGKANDNPPYTVERDADGTITAVTAAAGIDEPITRVIGEAEARVPITGPGVFADGGDFFQALIDLRDGLLNDDPDVVTNAADALDGIESHVVSQQSRIGSFLNRVDSSVVSLEERDLQAEARRSRAVDADLADAMVSLATQETLYQAALQVASRISTLSMMNYL